MSLLSNASHANEVWLSRLGDPQELTKSAYKGANYTRTFMRESGVARKVINPQMVTKADCQRAVSHEGLTKIIDVEPNSAGLLLDWLAGPTGNYITAPRFEVSFFTVASELFQK